MIKNIIKKVKDFLSRVLLRFKSLSRKKKTFVIIVLIILFFIVSNSISSATKEPPYKLEKASIGSLTEVVSETGKVISANRVEVYSPTNGLVTEVRVKNGDVVQEGDVLLEVKSSASEQEEKAAQADYLSALAALNDARSTANMLKSDMLAKWQTYKDTATNDTYENEDGSPRHDQRSSSEFHIAQNDWLGAEAKYKDQQTKISAASAGVEATRIAYQATQDSIVKATVDGTVSNLSVASGSGVTIKTATAATTPVLTLVSFTLTETSVLLGEDDIGKVAEGQSVEIDLSAVDDKKYKGIVRRVDSIGTEQAGVVRYSAYIEILDADDKIRPGMSTDVEIVTKKVNDVLTVPNSSIKPYEGGRAVRVIDPKTKQIKFIPVKIGIRGEKRTQILSGIKAGQEVVVSASGDGAKRPSLF